MGLHRAGFDVIGVDHKRQPRYPFTFVQADALKPPFDLSRFDFIWASPPCQAFVSLRWMHNSREHPDLIEPTRAMLAASGCGAWCIENVPGAPLLTEFVLCGTMFDLGHGDAELLRHRKFETSWRMPLFSIPPCRHGRRRRVIGVYGGHGRDRRRLNSDRGGQDFPVIARQEAMGIDWMTGEELSNAIPPAYSEFIGRAALAHLRREAA
jgi:DNA (cytosine-5)-methyltransferase 1